MAVRISGASFPRSRQNSLYDRATSASPQRLTAATDAVQLPNDDGSLARPRGRRPVVVDSHDSSFDGGNRFASGTATVEAALAGTPFVVVYRLAALTWMLGRNLVSLDMFAMPNLIAERRIVPELLQSDLTADNIVRELNAIVPDGAPRRQMLADLQEVREKLRDSRDSEAPALRAAREILMFLT